MINIICDVCGEELEGGYYTTIKTWGTYPTAGYLEQTIHVCSGYNKLVQGFIRTMTKEKR